MGESLQYFKLRVYLLIMGLSRAEVFTLRKSFKDIKRYIKAVKRELSPCSVALSIEIPDTKEESFYSVNSSIQDPSLQLLAILKELLRFSEVR